MPAARRRPAAGSCTTSAPPPPGSAAGAGTSRPPSARRRPSCRTGAARPGERPAGAMLVGTGLAEQVRPVCACNSSSRCSMWCQNWIASATVHQRPAAPDEPGAQHPQPDEHHDGVAVVQPFGADQPRERHAEHPAGLRPRPAQAPDLVRLHEVLGPVRQHDHEKRVQGGPVVRAVECRPTPGRSGQGRLVAGHVASSKGDGRARTPRPHPACRHRHADASSNVAQIESRIRQTGPGEPAGAYQAPTRRAAKLAQATASTRAASPGRWRRNSVTTSSSTW